VGALSVYLEPLVADARVAVLGDGELGFHARLLEMGARSVHLFDPDPERVARTADEVPRGVSVRMLRDDFDVRDGAFDLVVIPDVGLLPDPSATIVRLRRVVDPLGAVVAMGRARSASADESLFPELAPAAVEYAELYDLFALQFEDVSMTGVLPFGGVVFAELGAGEELAVSVDTRLAPPEPPGVFVVVASREGVALDAYAIVQLAREPEGTPAVGVRVPEVPQQEARRQDAEVAYAAMALKVAMLETQLEEQRARVAAASNALGQDFHARLEQLALERDGATTRAAELESVLAAAQQALALLERRLVAAEQGMLDRDDRLAAVHAELDAHEADEDTATENIDPSVVLAIVERAERAEASLALHVADLAQASEAHANETAGLEEQLRERARLVAAMEHELVRREQLVRELVTSLEEAREGGGVVHTFEAAPPLPLIAPEEMARLRRKLDELALDVARREGELVAQAWRINELEVEQQKTRAALQRARAEAAALAAAPLATPTLQPPRSAASTAAAANVGAGNGGSAAELTRDLARARDELDALRQALTQEHAARVAAESGEALAHARAELARQAVLLEQLQHVEGHGTHPEG
jgi:hypothetical protein